jgi:hypothetical protein
MQYKNLFPDDLSFIIADRDPSLRNELLLYATIPLQRFVGLTLPVESYKSTPQRRENSFYEDLGNFAKQRFVEEV